MINVRRTFKLSLRNRNVFVLFMIVLVGSFTASYGTTQAKDHSIRIQFHYNTDALPGKQLVGYNLYKDGEIICNTSLSESEIQDFECSFQSPGGYFPFTLTALFSNRTESPHSAPFSLMLIDESMAVLGLKVLSGQNPESTDGIGPQSGTSQIDMADVIKMLRELP
jgi:hypothetical protein